MTYSSRVLSSSDDDDFRGSCLGPGTDVNEAWFNLFACLDLKAIMLIVCLIVLGMLALCLLVEELFEWWNRLARNSPFWRSFLKAVEKELMVLGVVSFGLFLFEQSLVGSENTEMEELAELIEYVHLLLFFGMVVYYLFVATVGALTLRHLRILRRFEESIKGDGPYQQKTEIALLEKSFDTNLLLYYLGFRYHWEVYNFYKMKHLFLLSQTNRNNAPPDLQYLDLTFDNYRYVDYVSSATTHLFVKMIHVGWRIWASVMLVVAVLCIVLEFTMKNNGFEDQLHSMWLTQGRFVEENNFVVNGLNIFGFIVLILSRLLYISTTSENHLDSIAKMAHTKLPPKEDAGSNADLGGDSSSTSLLPAALVGGDPKRTPLADPLRRFSSTMRSWEDPYRALWFLKAPDLMIRVYQSQILFFAMYAGCFILNLRFANSYAWVFFVVYPALILGGMAYKLIPHYASIRYIGTLTIDNALREASRGGGSVSDQPSNDHHH